MWWPTAGVARLAAMIHTITLKEGTLQCETFLEGKSGSCDKCMQQSIHCRVYLAGADAQHVAHAELTGTAGAANVASMSSDTDHVCCAHQQC